jgi:hypothetical protein
MGYCGEPMEDVAERLFVLARQLETERNALATQVANLYNEGLRIIANSDGPSEVNDTNEARARYDDAVECFMRIGATTPETKHPDTERLTFVINHPEWIYDRMEHGKPVTVADIDTARKATP